MQPIQKSEAEWRKELTPEQYHILREKGTEAAGTGKYYHSTETGMYHCGACGAALFSSDAKFDSGSGWPSFYEPATPDSVKLTQDDSHGMRRTEVTCGRCGSHLGHVFDDGPQPTGKRFCINSLALDMKKG
ncbi:peptide-methionine (R)-S-oxide reductase MsrB [Candidatus Uhrbacteria bacterium]|nr:peptide-methionine (R)-S-oxide reductase MsrB [Candidatus Uhrbacteria bacterium]